MDEKQKLEQIAGAVFKILRDRSYSVKVLPQNIIAIHLFETDIASFQYGYNGRKNQWAMHCVNTPYFERLVELSNIMQEAGRAMARQVDLPEYRRLEILVVDKKGSTHATVPKIEKSRTEQRLEMEQVVEKILGEKTLTVQQLLPEAAAAIPNLNISLLYVLVGSLKEKQKIRQVKFREDNRQKVAYTAKEFSAEEQEDQQRIEQIRKELEEGKKERGHRKKLKEAVKNTILNAVRPLSAAGAYNMLSRMPGATESRVRGYLNHFRMEGTIIVAEEKRIGDEARLFYAPPDYKGQTTLAEQSSDFEKKMEFYSRRMGDELLQIARDGKYSSVADLLERDPALHRILRNRSLLGKAKESFVTDSH